ncbi:MAG: type II toxin-antitoxin system VapC family toxin [Kiritimatiellae bacterium]|nr:type II toxin-antitoxin system VapC family toxin [Kiritimatiellia bacterium]
MKYLVDTCVLSELAKNKPNANVVKWLKSHSDGNLFFVSVVTLGEIKEGIETLSDEDPRKKKLRTWFEEQILGAYEGSIVDFDREVALKWGEIKGMTNRMGRTRPDLDAQIAATAVVHGMTVITRNVSDMEYTGAEVEDPF